jgi:peroxiredoxin/uncharacterized membrane protein YphA (DoxX/SURF4 family)
MPSGLLVAMRLVLVAVFTIAGLAKARDRAGTRTALADFGAPVVAIPAVSGLLPATELAVAGCLLVDGAARAGAVGALLLLAVFSAAIAIALARGRTPDCHCFGQVHPAPIGAGTLVRNALLGVVATVVVIGGAGTGVVTTVSWIGDLSIRERLGLAAAVAVTLALAAQGWLVLQLLHQQGRLLLRIEALEGSPGLGEGLEVGAPAPAFTLPAVSGGSVGLDDLTRAGRPVLALFVSPSCRPCSALLPDLAHWQHEHASRVTVAIVARGDEAENRAHASGHGLEPVLLDPENSVALAYRALPTPSAVLIGPDGRVRSRVAAGADAIRGLLVRVLDTRAGHEAHAVAAPLRHQDELQQPLEV